MTGVSVRVARQQTALSFMTYSSGRTDLSEIDHRLAIQPPLVSSQTSLPFAHGFGDSVFPDSTLSSSFALPHRCLIKAFRLAFFGEECIVE
jgi:hypothetical protein